MIKPFTIIGIALITEIRKAGLRWTLSTSEKSYRERSYLLTSVNLAICGYTEKSLMFLDQLSDEQKKAKTMVMLNRVIAHDSKISKNAKEKWFDHLLSQVEKLKNNNLKYETISNLANELSNTAFQARSLQYFQKAFKLVKVDGYHKFLRIVKDSKLDMKNKNSLYAVAVAKAKAIRNKKQKVVLISEMGLILERPEIFQQGIEAIYHPSGNSYFNERDFLLLKNALNQIDDDKYNLENKYRYINSAFSASGRISSWMDRSAATMEIAGRLKAFGKPCKAVQVLNESLNLLKTNIKNDPRSDLFIPIYTSNFLVAKTDADFRLKNFKRITKTISGFDETRKALFYGKIQNILTLPEGIQETEVKVKLYKNLANHMMEFRSEDLKSKLMAPLLAMS